MNNLFLTYSHWWTKFLDLGFSVWRLFSFVTPKQLYLDLFSNFIWRMHLAEQYIVVWLDAVRSIGMLTCIFSSFSFWFKEKGDKNLQVCLALLHIVPYFMCNLFSSCRIISYCWNYTIQICFQFFFILFGAWLVRFYYLLQRII